MDTRNDLLALASTDDDGLDEDMDLDVFDDELDEELDEEMDGEMAAESSRSKKVGRGQNWRRIELLQEDRLLKLAMADFDDYDFDYADSASESAYSH